VYQGQYSTFRQRRHGRPPAGVRPDQLVVFSQNHDQIGNRARGERLSMMLELPELEAVAALTLLSPFVPLLFQGEEWGARTPFLYFTDHEDPALGRAVSEGRAREFERFRWSGEVPDPQSRETFERSKLDWSELAEPAHAAVFEWYRRLAALRHARPEGLRSAKAKVRFDARAGWLTLEHAGLTTLLNFSHQGRRVPVPAGEWTLALASDGAAGAGTIEGSAEVPGRVTRVYRRG
jgi:maltooligosyltrehalose trehalohydrolase